MAECSAIARGFLLSKVQTVGTKRNGRTSSTKEDKLPTYMRRNPNGPGYEFRRGVPKALRPVIRLREIKEVLEGSFAQASRRVRELAVKTDRQFEEARAELRAVAAVAAAPKPRRDRHQYAKGLTVIDQVTPELLDQVKSMWVSLVAADDLSRRENGFQSSDESGFESLSKAEVAEAHAETGAMLKRAWADGDPSPFIHAMRFNFALRGYSLDEKFIGSPEEQKLAMAFVRGGLEGLRLIEARNQGDDPPVPDITLPLGNRRSFTLDSPDPAAPRGEAMQLSQVIGHFLQNWPSNKKAMLKKHQALLAGFLEVTGDMPITQLRQAHVNDFFRLIQRLPPRWKDACRQQGIGLIELAAQDHATVIGPATFDDSYKASFRLFLQNAKRDWQDIGFPTTLTVEGIQYDGKRKAGEFKQRAMKIEELKRLFEGPELQEYASQGDKVQQFWLPTVGLYTGARVNEICQVNPQSDVKRDAETGIWYLRLTDEGDAAPDVEKSIKTGKSRNVPIHRHLIELGFLEYVDAIKKMGAVVLFPQWKPYQGKASANAAKWFRRFLAKIGLHGVANEEGNSLRGSHIFRHTLLTYGVKAKLNLRCISGHEELSENPVADEYEDDTILLPLEEKQRRLDRLDYGINIPRPIMPTAPIHRKMDVKNGKREANQANR